jgi:hypothetical protein
MTFKDVLFYCAGQDEFVAQWERLRGVRLPRSPIEKMIDEATGNDSAIARLFINDVFDLVWSRLTGNGVAPCSRLSGAAR